MTTKKNRDVGYGRPPRHTQFKKGQSGNPRGRPRVRPSVADMFRKILREKAEVKIGGRTVKIEKSVLFLRQLVNRGLSGEARASNHVLGLMKEFGILKLEDEHHHVTIELVKAPPRDADGNLIRKSRKKKSE